MTIKDEGLKACPFCGDPMARSGQLIRHQDQDRRCPIRQQAWPVEEADFWNTRPTPTDQDTVERVARAIAPDSWMRKDEGGRGISLDIAIDHSLAAAERVRAALQSKGQS